jgi:FtsP/CotA-like multicopper oxidase with cupredoxin domain
MRAPHFRRLFCISVLLVLAAGALRLFAQSSGVPSRVVANDNRTPAGTLVNGVLELKLSIQNGLWFPEDERGTGLLMEMFGEEGKAPSNPGPLVRVPEGTEIHVSIHNLTKHAAIVHGFRTRPSADTVPLEVGASATREVRFRAGAAGTYYYWATTTGAKSFEDRETDTADTQLAGAFIVDPAAGAPPDRVFFINLVELSADPFHDGMGSFIVNGKEWPYTERLTYRVGEHARWRYINFSPGLHPMHLHGSYFNVVAVGDGERDEVYRDADKRSVVTEAMNEGATMAVDWVPERTGRWIFHCHLAPHFSPDNQLPRVTYPESWGPEYASPKPAESGHADHAGMTDGGGMAGLVVGITVLPGASSPAPSPAARTIAPARRLELIAASRPPGSGNSATLGYTIRENGRDLPARDAMVSPPLVLTQGQPVEVKISNRLKAPTAVHWHGIELDSYYDGVAGWGGDGRQVTPSIAPGGSFVARFTPPRAGTFIYHTHWHDAEQLVKGLYGPLIILPPGQTFDPATDKIVLISIDGPKQNRDPFLVNGTTNPLPMTLRAGTRYRFRLINLTADNPGMTVSLLDGDQGVSWRAIAKDGADLPEAQRRAIDAKDVRVSVGETYDFEFIPGKTGRLTLDVFRPVDKKHVVTDVEVR